MFQKFGSALATFFVLAIFFNSWKLSLLLMLTIAVHEYGHIFAAKLAGIKTKGFYFSILGGFTQFDSDPKDAFSYGYIALCGPAIGSLLAIPFGILWQISGNLLYAHAVCWVLFVNVFNLIPMFPLDGWLVLKVSTLPRLPSKIGLWVFYLGAIAGGMVMLFNFGLFMFVIFWTLMLPEARFIRSYIVNKKEKPIENLAQEQELDDSLLPLFLKNPMNNLQTVVFVFACMAVTVSMLVAFFVIYNSSNFSLISSLQLFKSPLF